MVLNVYFLDLHLGNLDEDVQSFYMHGMDVGIIIFCHVHIYSVILMFELFQVYWGTCFFTVFSCSQSMSCVEYFWCKLYGFFALPR